MQKSFVESSRFTRWVVDFLSDEEYVALQEELLANPDAGRVMPGCGGLRKLRVADRERSKGKRGGARIIYLHLPERNLFYMVDGYGKDERDDLTAEMKKVFRQMVEELRRNL